MKKITLIFMALIATTFMWQSSAQVTLTGSNNTVVGMPDDDPVGVSSLVNIAGAPAGATVADIEIDMAINHTWAGDMEITLTGPGGESILLVTRPGAPPGTAGDSSNLSSSFPITFSDGATVNAEDMGDTIPGGDVICEDDLICSFRPNVGVAPDTFADLAAAINAGSLTINGDWDVHVSDNAGGDFGDFAIPELRVSYYIGNPPVIVCPSDIVAGTDPGACGAIVNYTDAIALDVEDGVLVATQTSGPLMSGDEFPVGDTVVTYEVTDSDGNTVSCSFTVTVNDTEPAAITCPDNITVDNDPGICGAVVTYPDPLVVDNCFTGGGLVSGTYDQTITITNPALLSVNTFNFGGAVVGASGDATLEVRTFGDIDGTGGNEEAWTIDDEDANTVGMIGATGDFGDQCNTTLLETFTIPAALIDTWAADGQIDFTGSDLAGNINLTLCGGDFLELRLVYDWAIAGPPVTYNVLQGLPSGSVFPVGTTLTELEYIDIGGNSVTCTFEVTVNDVEAPVIACAGEPTTLTGSGSDSPALAIPDNDPAGISTTLTVTDDFTITDLNVDLDISHTWVGDIAITIESPAGTTAVIMDRPGVPATGFGCDGDDIVASLDDEAATPVEDECGAGIPTISGSFIPNNPLSVFDGESTMGDWILTVADNALGDFGTINTWGITYEYDAPIVPFDVVLDANGMASIPASDLILTATDNCGAVVVTTAGTPPVPGSLTTLFGSDNGGDPGGTVYFDVTVGPENINISDMDINTPDGGALTMDIYTLVGTYAGNENDAAAWGAPAASASGTGAGLDVPTNMVLGTPLVLNANTTYGMAIVLDGGHAHAYTNGDGTNENYSNADLTVDLGAATNVPFTGTIFSPRVFNGTFNYTTGTAPNLMVDFDCSQLGETLVDIMVTDSSGNSSFCTATVNVIDDTDPILVCWDATLELGPDGTLDVDPDALLAITDAVYDVMVIGSDDGSNLEGFTDFTVDITEAANISFDWDYVLNDLPGFDSFGYLLNGVYTQLTDPGLGNQNGSANVAVVPGDVFGFRSQTDDNLFGNNETVISNFMPGFEGQFDQANWNLSLTNSNGDAFFVEVIPAGPLSFDACGITVLAVDVTEVTCADIGTPITATVFASDASGNIASCTSVITVVDLLGPELTCPPDQTVDPGAGSLFYTVPDYFATGEATAEDNCTDPVTITSQDPVAGTQLPDGTYTITCTAEDEYGNVSTCTFELTVETVLGVDDNALDVAIALYPNPAQSQVTLSNSSNILLDKAAIFDVNGKKVMDINLQGMQSEKVIDISSLASGVYMVQISGEQASVVKRLIKE